MGKYSIEVENTAGKELATVYIVSALGHYDDK